jgi:hypothetical protein
MRRRHRGHHSANAPSLWPQMGDLQRWPRRAASRDGGLVDVDAEARAERPGRRGSPDEMGTEEWQAEKLRRHWAQVVERPFLAGYMFWLMRDYKERMAYNRFEYNGISAMGLSDFHGVRRLAFFAYRDAEP